MSNTYGFDFLKSEHKLSATGIAAPVPPTSSISSSALPSSIPLDAVHKPDLEKQFDVLHFLQAHRSAGHLAPSVIFRGTGIDLQDEEHNATVVKMLQSNAKINIEYIPDPENPSLKLATYAYQAKYHHVRDRASLLAQINRCQNGVGMKDLIDAYEGVEADLNALMVGGDVVAVANPEDRDKILFPRGEAFLVELDGVVSLRNIPQKPTTTPTTAMLPPSAVSSGETATNNNSSVPDKYVVKVDMDPLKQVRRGEAVCVGGQWFRVSSAIKEGVPLSEQPTRAQAPLSVVSLQDLSNRNEDVDGYIRPFTDKLLPLDDALSSTALQNIQKTKAARERLAKLAGGRGLLGGAAAQLLSSTAHATNPTTLASSFVSSVRGGGSASSGSMFHRKRPSQQAKPTSVKTNREQAQKDAQAAQEAASDVNLTLYSHARRHGCTKDVRELYLSSRDLVPQDETELYNKMLEHKLLQPGEAMKRPRLVRHEANLDNDGKPKKRRYYERKDQRMTNTHLIGTELWAVLAQATEKQKQGKDVGDGGM